MATNRLQTAQNFDVNTIGTISGAIKSPVKSIQEIAWMSNPTSSSPAMAKPSLNQQTQQSQAGSTIWFPSTPTVQPSEQFFTPMPTTIPATGWGNNMFTKPVDLDTIISIAWDTEKLTPLEDLQARYPEVPSDKMLDLAIRITEQTPLEDLKKEFPFIQADTQQEWQKLPWLKTASSASDLSGIPYIWGALESLNKKTDALNIVGTATEKLDEIVASLTDKFSSGVSNALWLSIWNREKQLNERLVWLDQQKIQEKKDQFYNLPSYMQEYYWSPEEYITESQKTLADQILWVGSEWPNVAKLFWSAVTWVPKFISWIVRSATNPFDSIVWVANVLWQRGYDWVQWAIKLWKWDTTIWDIAKDATEYLATRMESDPVWLASDILSIVWMSWLTKPFLKTSWNILWKATWQNINVAWSLEWLPNRIDAWWWWLDVVINKFLSSENAIKLSQKMDEYMAQWWKVNMAKAWAIGWIKMLIEANHPIDTTFKYLNKASWAMQETIAWMIIPDDRIKKQLQTDMYITDLVDDVEMSRSTLWEDFDFQEYVNSKLDEYAQWATKTLDMLENKRRELSPAYEDMKKMWVPLEITPVRNKVLDILSDPSYGITIVDWKLNFTSSSTVSVGERAWLQMAYDIINEKWVKTYGELLDSRQAIKNDKWVDFKNWSTPVTQKVYEALDWYMKENIPFFDDVTLSYRDKIQEIQEVKWLLFDKEGNIQKWVYTKLMNINSPTNIEFKKKLMDSVPQLVAQAESLQLLKSLDKLKNSTTWLWRFGRLFQAVLWYSGYGIFWNFLWWLAWYTAWEFLRDVPINYLQDLRYDYLVKIMKKMPTEHREFLWEVAVKMSQNEELSKIEQQKTKNLLEQINRQAEVLSKMQAYKWLSINPEMIVNK